MRSGRRRLRGSAVRRRGAVRAASGRGAEIGFAAFAGVFLIAIAAGIISNVPGGVGVFESVFLLLFQAVPADHAARARCSPTAHLLSRSLCRGAGPARRARDLGAPGPIVRVARLGRTWLSAVTPQASALAVFGAGAVLLFSGATPGLWQSPGHAAPCRSATDARAVAPVGQRRRRRL